MILHESFISNITEQFGDDDDLVLSISELHLVLELLNYSRPYISTYYSNIYAQVIDILHSQVEFVLDTYHLPSDITLSTKVLYNNNVNSTIFDILNDQQSSYSKKLRSIWLRMLVDGTTVGDLKKTISDLNIKPSDKSLHGPNARAMTAFRTEYTRVRTEVKLNIEQQYISQGYDVTKSWLYTYESNLARQSHQDHDGSKANKDGLFLIHGKLTRGPGLFGDPSEDMNCRCDINLVISSRPK